MVSKLFRDPQARSSALATLGTLQPRAFRSLNRVVTLDSVSNYYIYSPHAQNHASSGLAGFKMIRLEIRLCHLLFSL